MLSRVRQTINWRCGFSKIASNPPRPQQRTPTQKKEIIHYAVAFGVFFGGLAYAFVPLYTLFCQSTGYSGARRADIDNDAVERMKPVKNREVNVVFTANKSSQLKWNFKPQQRDIRVRPGETALAFYTAKNETSKPVVGISSYNILPLDAAQYFVKIQCFCFEEQILNPGEQVDMPVFFYIDPNFAFDPRLMETDTIILAYTFFEATPNLQLPLPDFLKKSIDSFY